jgi:hypothetical protein
MRGRNSRTSIASPQRSTDSTASWRQSSHVTKSERTPSERMLPIVIGGPGGEGMTFRSRLALRLFLVVDHVLRVLRKIIICVESLAGDLAGRRLFCALRDSLQRSTQTSVRHLSLQGMRSSAACKPRADNARRVSLIQPWESRARPPVHPRSKHEAPTDGACGAWRLHRCEMSLFCPAPLTWVSEPAWQRGLATPLLWNRGRLRVAFLGLSPAELAQRGYPLDSEVTGRFSRRLIGRAETSKGRPKGSLFVRWNGI